MERKHTALIRSHIRKNYLRRSGHKSACKTVILQYFMPNIDRSTKNKKQGAKAPLFRCLANDSMRMLKLDYTVMEMTSSRVIRLPCKKTVIQWATQLRSPTASTDNLHSSSLIRRNVHQETSSTAGTGIPKDQTSRNRTNYKQKRRTFLRTSEEEYRLSVAVMGHRGLRFLLHYPC